MNTGVYIIEHIASGKKYVGSASRSFYGRWHSHRSSLRKGTHHSVLLQRAWDKYGDDAFVFRIIEPCLPEHATGVEQVFIDWYKSTDPELGYNICHIAGSSLGLKRTAEARAKISAANTGRKLSAEHCAKQSAARRGKKHTAEHRAKISATLKGNKVSAETRAKIGSTLKGNKNSLGFKHTAAARANMSAAAMGNKNAAKRIETS